MPRAWLRGALGGRLRRADGRRWLCACRCGGRRSGFRSAEAEPRERRLIELAARVEALCPLELLKRGLGLRPHAAVHRHAKLSLRRADGLDVLRPGEHPKRKSSRHRGRKEQYACHRGLLYVPERTSAMRVPGVARTYYSRVGWAADLHARRFRLKRRRAGIAQ